MLVLLEKFRTRKHKDTVWQLLSVKFVDMLVDRERKKCLKYLKGDILILHCKGHDTIILLFDFDHFHTNHRRLLNRNFLCREKTMNCC